MPRATASDERARVTTQRVSSAPPAWKGTPRFEVVGCLGQGGMGVVYEAFDRERRQRVALKMLLNFDPAGLYRFKQEFRTLADVQHINLVHLYELVVADDGQVFFTMELVRGRNFLQYVERPELRTSSHPPAATVVNRCSAAARAPSRPRPAGASDADEPPSRRLNRSPADVDLLRPALRQLVEGVRALHAAGKMHRDIKPSNVLVTAEGRVVLLDFGVATEVARRDGDSAAESQEMVGTANYMAPEQALAEAPTPASDWYSVGVVLYEALVGRPPFVGSATDVLTLKSTLEPPPPSACVAGIPADLDELCMALLLIDPAKRPPATEILRRLGMSPGASQPSPAAPQAPSAFFGRERQLQKLREAFEALRGGRGSTVRIGGASGMGKSTLVHWFLDELAGSGALVIRGRAYERESVPYKALDSVVDALSRHLVGQDEAGTPVPPPENARALGRLFPVLQRVPGFEPPDPEPIADPQAMRRMAFRALRALLDSLGRRQPLVIFVDDVHWGDVDSAGLLLELLRPPDAPPFLLVMTFRDEEAKTSRFLNEMRSRWPAAAEGQDVTVGPLGAEDARKLATLLLEPGDDRTRQIAHAVERESCGSPFLIEELVRSNRGVAGASGATLAIVTLDQMVSDRIERLPEQARRLIEILAVSGRRLPVSVVATAAGVEDGVHELVSVLGARRFVRTGLRDGREIVEMIHDRVKETIVGLLPERTVREHHERLAQVLGEFPGADIEAIAVHWLGAGDRVRAARFAEGAAEEAAAKLAFDQAARLYKLAMDGASAVSADARRLLPRYACALQLAGRFEESAAAFLAAAEGATPEEKVEFQRAAAQQMISAGRPDEGGKLLRGVLAGVGMSAPRSPGAAVFWLIVYRVWFAIIGLRFKERAPEELSPEDRLRIDALNTVAMGFSAINVVLAACMQIRHQIEAFRRGDLYQVLRAAGLAAAHLATPGGRESNQERALLEISRSLSERDGSQQALSQHAGVCGVGAFQRGDFRQARDYLERVYGLALHDIDGFANFRLFAIYARFYLGEFDEMAKRAQALLLDAEDRRDRYTIVNLQTSIGVHTALMADAPQAAREAVRTGLENWRASGFDVQHWQAMCFAPDADLYEGTMDGVYERFTSGLPRLRRSLLLHAGFIRTFTQFARGRIAIGSIEAAPAQRDARIADALRCARLLDREYLAWTKVFAAIVRACAENAAGRRDAAIAQLRLALELMEANHVFAYRDAVRCRLGQLLGGDDGMSLTARAKENIAAQGIRSPERWVRFILPGGWGDPPGVR